MQNDNKHRAHVVHDRNEILKGLRVPIVASLVGLRSTLVPLYELLYSTLHTAEIPRKLFICVFDPAKENKMF